MDDRYCGEDIQTEESNNFKKDRERGRVYYYIFVPVITHLVTEKQSIGGA